MEPPEESSKLGHCVLARTQQNAAKKSTTREGPEYSTDNDFTWGANSSKYQITRKDSKSKRMTLQDGRMDEGLNDQAERNEEPPD